MDDQTSDTSAASSTDPMVEAVPAPEPAGTDEVAVPAAAAETVVTDPMAEAVPAPEPAGADEVTVPATAAEPSPRPPRPKTPRRPRAGGGKRQKEAFWVRVALPDGTSQFFPATDHIGKVMPFSNPKETCAMRVYPEVVCFSLLHLTKRAAKDLREKPIAVPHAPLSRLARRSAEVNAGAGTIVVEHRTEVDGETFDRSVTMSLDVSDARVATLESDDPAADEAFELGGRGERISVFLTSPTVGRRVALGYIGHLGRPGTADTLARCAAKIINASAALPEFALLTGIEAADVPGMPGGVTVVRPTTTRAGIDIPVRLFSGDMPPAAVGVGAMRVDLDLEHANASTDRLLFSVTPDANLEEVFGPYREVADRWLNGRLAELLGDEIKMIIYDIVLGEVTEDTVKRINEKLINIGRVDFTPTQFRDPDQA